MVYQNISLMAAFLLFYSIFAGRFEARYVNGPLMFLLIGLLAGPAFLGVLQIQAGSEEFRLLAEITLAIVLFTDAANANFSVLRANNWIPLKLLLIGLPLCLLAGWLFAKLLYPDMPWLEAAILATILAPTDAALGKAVVSNPGVPAPVREGLNVESGLNDGICVPVLLLLLALIAPEEQHKGTLVMAIELFIEEIGIGLLVAIFLSFVSVRLLRRSKRLSLSSPLWHQLIMPSLAVLSFSLAQSLGGSGFIAAFCCGMLIGLQLKTDKEHFLHSNEGFGELFSVVVWMTFGAAVIFMTWPYFTWKNWLYALASLTILRMLPVWISLAGKTMLKEQRLFIGWFGPRGLASIVFLIIAGQYELIAKMDIYATVIATIFLSVLLHGITAISLLLEVSSSN